LDETYPPSNTRSRTRRAVTRWHARRRRETSGARALRDDVACRKGSSVGRRSVALGRG
jgi:hypothetical protein